MNFETKLLKSCPELIDEVAQLWYDVTIKENFPNGIPPKLIQDLHSYLNDDKLPLCMIALNNGEVIGLVRVIEHWTTDKNIAPFVASHMEYTPWVCSLIVHNKYRKVGVAKTLMQSVKQKLKNINIHTFYLGVDSDNSTGMKTVYLRYGCEKIAEDYFREIPTTILKYNID
jgi:ribosomal protein S18 acetylase RimI-like enzyme